MGTPAVCSAHTHHSGSSRSPGDYRRQEQCGTGLARQVVLVEGQTQLTDPSGGCQKSASSSRGSGEGGLVLWGFLYVEQTVLPCAFTLLVYAIFPSA